MSGSIRAKLEKLRKKIPEPRPIYQISWYYPDTGKVWRRMTLTPDNSPSGWAVEEWEEESPEHPEKQPNE